MSDSLKLAQICAKYAEEIQAGGIEVLDLRGLSSLADFFVICSASSAPHLKAISRDIRHNTAEETGESPRSAEGEASSQWLVLDYVDVVVHIFHEEKRDFYALEDLWSDAPRISVDSSSSAASD